jgi:hypothetical protein
MINLKPIIETVDGLLAQGTAQGTTYAALECRLAIEKDFAKEGIPKVLLDLMRKYGTLEQGKWSARGL